MNGHCHPPRNGFFVAGEIMLQAEHDAPLQAGNLIQWVRELWNHCGLDLPDLQPENLIPVSFKTKDGTFSSLVRVPVPHLLEECEEDHDVLWANDVELMHIVNTLNDTVPPFGHAIKLQAAAPNWCVTSCGHSLTHPCPGGEPSPANNIQGNRWGFLNSSFDNAIQNVEGSSPTNVVIFDTVLPGLNDDFTYNKLIPNILLEQLRDLKNQGRFVIRYASESTLGIELPAKLAPDPDHDEELCGYGQHDGYDMSDHGLFIAGIVHTLAPDANIYLVETQNNFGVGTVTSLAQGVEALINGGIIPSGEMGRPLIVNCSLAMDFEPLDELRKLGYDPVHLEQDLTSLRTTLELLETAFEATQIRIIAAAGNNAPYGSSSIPDACYPAAFEFVLGVGAMEGELTRAWYSNKADTPPQYGLMVFGGKANPAANRNVSDTGGDGMLGVYTRDFPDGTGNDNGWAWWSGTSFAAGVMSGMFARASAAGQNINRGIANDFRAKSKQHRNGTTSQNEPFIATPQNP